MEAETMTPQELVKDLRSRINPLYAATSGTESYERRICAETIEELMMEIDRLSGLLAEAADSVADWGSYASQHFQEKHNLAGDVDRFRAAANA